MTDLTQAIAELRRDGPTDAPWTASLVADGNPYPSSLAGAVATVLNAAASGELFPLAEHKLAVALMVEKAENLTREIVSLEAMCDHDCDNEDCVRCFHYPEILEQKKAARSALADTDALAELQALRGERDRLDAATNTLSEMWEGEQTARHSAEAELATLRAQNERLTGALAVWHDGSRPIPFDRDTVGRMVRDAWVRWAETQPSPKPSWLVPYEELSEPDKEADRQIGEAVARWTLAFDASRAALTEGAAP